MDHRALLLSGVLSLSVWGLAINTLYRSVVFGKLPIEVAGTVALGLTGALMVAFGMVVGREI